MLVGDFYNEKGELLTEGAVIFDSLLQSINDKLKINEQQPKGHVFTFVGNHSYILYTKESHGHKVGSNEKKSTSIDVQCELVTEYLASERIE